MLLLAAAALVAVPSHAQSDSATALAQLRPKALQRRVAANPDFSAKVRLGGHLPGWVRAENTASAVVPVSAPLDVTVVLKRDAATEAAFQKLLAEQQTPGSALYHQWLTPAQVGQMFGVAPADLQAVESWLESQGLKVTRVEPNGVLLDVTGSVAAVSGAFRTNFAEFRVGRETRLSATSEPSVPQALEAVIAGVHGLSQSTLHPQSIATVVQGKLTAQVSGGGLTAKPMMTSTGGGHYLTPNDFATIYDLGSVYSGGNTGATVAGKAQRIAIVGRSRVAATDISQFENMTGLPTAQPNVIVPTGGIDPGTTSGGDQDEATLDVDRVIGTAPGAGVDLVVSGDSKTVSGIYTAAAYEVNTLVDPVMSISFGDCEANVGQQGVSVWDTLFSAAAAEGISVLVSSGDSGAAGCDGDSSTLPLTQKASINYICSSSYVTCVGGTEFADTSSAGSYWSAQNGSGESSAVSYIPEGAWNEPTSTSGAKTTYAASSTGGGASAYIAKPGWQTGAGVPADGMRDVPDVSLSSAVHDGYMACLAYAGGDCSQQKFEVFGGTSAAAPGMAGIIALMNTASGSAAGNVNPLLYRLAASSSDVFHDVTEATAGIVGCSVAVPSMCNNSTPSSAGLTGGLTGFEVAAGFDQSTGWGSVDAAKLIAAAMAAGGSSGFGGRGELHDGDEPGVAECGGGRDDGQYSDGVCDGGERVYGHGVAELHGDGDRHGGAAAGLHGESGDDCAECCCSQRKWCSDGVVAGGGEQRGEQLRIEWRRGECARERPGAGGVVRSAVAGGSETRLARAADGGCGGGWNEHDDGLWRRVGRRSGRDTKLRGAGFGDDECGRLCRDRHRQEREYHGEHQLQRDGAVGQLRWNGEEAGTKTSGRRRGGARGASAGTAWAAAVPVVPDGDPGQAAADVLLGLLRASVAAEVGPGVSARPGVPAGRRRLRGVRGGYGEGVSGAEAQPRGGEVRGAGDVGSAQRDGAAVIVGRRPYSAGG